MEPIRPDRSRFADRRRTGSARAGLGESGGFAGRLDSIESSETESAPSSDLEPVDTSGLPGLDAPTAALFDAVHAAGQRLSDEQTYTAAQLYREAVRRFLRKVFPDAQTLEVHESSRGILNRKRYVLLTEVNRSVERLVSGLLQTQRRQLDTLARLEEIEGMLVDLLH